MARAFAKIAFTSKVREVQARMGSREVNRGFELGDVEGLELGPNEIDFILSRDSCYQGTVSETGWPYVQHRGGPAGFIKVLDRRTIGYADFSGNRQYISVGNLTHDDRVSLFLMDYPGQRRLKIWGRARVVEENDEPELIAQLECPDYRARVERGVVITVDAFDWNCPKHITPRFTERELGTMVQGWRIREPGKAAATAEISWVGTGPLELVVTGVRALSPSIRAYELRAPDWGRLPAVTPGAHLRVPVRLSNGSLTTRQYSLTGDLERHDLFEIAVLRKEGGRGGSDAIHASWQIGTRLRADLPENHFPLHSDNRHAVLVAGGIGITPIRAMALALMARGIPFEVHYSARTPREMAYRDLLAKEIPDRVSMHFTAVENGSRIDLPSIMSGAPADTLFYVCGPSRLIAAVRGQAQALGISPERVHCEDFE